MTNYLNTGNEQVREDEGFDALAARNQQVDAELRQRLYEKRAQAEQDAKPTLQEYPFICIKKDIVNAIESLGLDSTQVNVGLPTQRTGLTRDTSLAFNVVAAAKDAQRHPIEVAAEIVDTLSKSGIGTVSAVGPFINIEVDMAQFGGPILSQAIELGEEYGHFRDADPQVVVVDYSAPNVAKNMTLAHLRSTIIGQSLTNIEEASGNIVLGINHIGDWGTQFGNIIFQYQKEFSERGVAFLDELHRDPQATLMRIYREFTENAKHENKDSHPTTRELGQEIFLELEQGDPHYLALWEKFREWSIEGFDEVYRRLGVEFDAVQGESFYEDRMQLAVQEALASGVLVTREDGAIVFPSQVLQDPETLKDLPRLMVGKADGGKAEEEPRDEIIVKPSGGTVYLTRDLAALVYRARELQAQKVLYVVGKEQQSHFIELFNMAQQLGAVALGGARHAWFGHLNVDGKKMKSREGKVVLLNEALDVAVEAAKDAITERRDDSSDMFSDEELRRAEMIGISSLAFTTLRQDRRKDIEFSPNLVGNLADGGATYIQYTHARLDGILGKIDTNFPEEAMPEQLSSIERALVIEIARLPEVIRQASHESAPHKLAVYLTDFCQQLNSFYTDKSHAVVSETDPAAKAFRVQLVRAAKQVVENTSGMLCVTLPGKM